MTTDQILFGFALLLALAVGSQVLASRLHIPALILLLPAGFTAGALTSDVNPSRLLGPAFQPLVSLAVAVILYDAGLGLDFAKLAGHIRRAVFRLIGWGVPITWGVAAVFAALLFGMSSRAALMIGVILVVSGPTVVGPLLGFIRPAERLRRVLIWEGSLIDPIGGILGAVVFSAVAGTSRGSTSAFAHHLADLLIALLIGLAGGAAGTAVLWLLLRKLSLGEVLGTSAQLATVVAIAAACDIAREDSGLMAAIVMGLALANMRGFDVPARRPFFETLVQLTIAVLFVSIAATVTPESLRHLGLPTIGLVAVLVLVTRPVVAFLATVRTDLTLRERAFVGWMAPRGIVAAATASTFGSHLAARHVGGATKILPVTFLVIVLTVAVYGLTAAPVARRLRVSRVASTRPLLVGGDPWSVDLAQALRSGGVDVVMWAGSSEQRERISQAGIELAPGELLANATGAGAELEGITTVLLMTEEDDFNALGATILEGSVDGPVLRLSPQAPSQGVVAPYTGGQILLGQHLSRPRLEQRYRAGSRFKTQRATGAVPAEHDLIFVIHADGKLAPVTSTSTPSAADGDTVILLSPAGAAGLRLYLFGAQGARVMRWPSKVFELDPAGPNWPRAVLFLDIALVPLVVFWAIGYEQYFLSALFGLIFAWLIDPGGGYGSRAARIAVFGLIGAGVTALGFGIGGDAWGWLVLAAFAVTLAAGLALTFGVHRFVAAVLLNLWFIIALALGSTLQHQTHITSYTWAQVLAWAGGSALWIVVAFIIWLIRGHEDVPQPVAEFPGDTSPRKLTRPVIMFAMIRALVIAGTVALAFGLSLSHGYWIPIATMVAMKPDLGQSALISAQRVAGAVIGAGAAALLLLIAANESGARLIAIEHGLEVVAIVLFMHAAATRFWNYALYSAAVAAGALILVDLPQPSNFDAVGYRVLWTLCGVAIAVLFMLLANLLARRAAKGPPQPTAAPSRTG